MNIKLKDSYFKRKKNIKIINKKLYTVLSLFGAISISIPAFFISVIMLFDIVVGSSYFLSP